MTRSALTHSCDPRATTNPAQLRLGRSPSFFRERVRGLLNGTKGRRAKVRSDGKFSEAMVERGEAAHGEPQGASAYSANPRGRIACSPRVPPLALCRLSCRSCDYSKRSRRKRLCGWAASLAMHATSRATESHYESLRMAFSSMGLII